MLKNPNAFLMYSVSNRMLCSNGYLKCSTMHDVQNLQYLRRSQTIRLRQHFISIKKSLKTTFSLNMYPACTLTMYFKFKNKYFFRKKRTCPVLLSIFCPPVMFCSAFFAHFYRSFFHLMSLYSSDFFSLLLDFLIIKCYSNRFS